MREPGKKILYFIYIYIFPTRPPPPSPHLGKVVAFGLTLWELGGCSLLPCVCRVNYFPAFPAWVDNLVYGMEQPKVPPWPGGCFLGLPLPLPSRFPAPR